MRGSDKRSCLRNLIGLLVLTLFCVFANLCVMITQSYIASRPTPARRRTTLTAVSRTSTPTPYPTPPFPNGRATPIPSWPLAKVAPTPVPISEYSAVRLARPGSPPDLAGSESIRAIVRQNQGDILWVGTDGGLLRWNPTTLVYDRITTADGLGSNRVNGIAVAPDGTIWAATAGGLSRYTPGRATMPDWTTYTVENTGGGLIDVVVDVAVDAEGQVWAGTASGLCRFTPNPDDLDGTWKTVTAEELPNIAVRALEVDTQGTLWVATDAGLFRADGDVLQAETAQGHLTDLSITALSQDSAGRLWVAASDGLLFRFDPTRKAWAVIPDGPGRPAGEVRALAAGNTSARMWVAAGGGLGRCQQIEQSAAACQTLPLPEPVATASVTALALDGSGILWVGTTNGLFRYWEVWDRHPAGPDTTARIASDRHGYHVIAFDDHGNLWTPKRLRRFDGQGWMSSREAERTAGEADRGIVIIGDGAGGVWAAHKLGTISHYDGHQWRAFTYQDQGLWSERDGAVMAVDRGGGLWVGYDGLAHVTWQDAARSGVDWQIFSGRRYSWGYVRDITVDNLGGVWIATNEWGLVRYADDTWTAYPHIAGHSNGRPEIVTAVTLDARGQLWTASGFYGVALFDGQAWQVRETTAGLSGYAIMQFVPDAAGGVWGLHSNENVSYMDGRSWWMYTQADGLPQQIYSATLNPISGRLWLSTEAGLIRFDGPRWERLKLVPRPP